MNTHASIPPMPAIIRPTAWYHWGVRIPVALAAGWSCIAGAQGAYTPLALLPAPAVIRSAKPFPGDAFKVAYLFDGQRKTEFSSDGMGTNTFVVVEFKEPVRLGAVRHVDRNDPATIAESELSVMDATGQASQVVLIPHAGKPGAETFFVLPHPITARQVIWRVSKLGPQGHGTVGGAELAFYAAGESEAVPRDDRLAGWLSPIVRKTAAGAEQVLRIEVEHRYAEELDAVLKVQGLDARPLRLRPGITTLDVPMPAVASTTALALGLEAAGQAIAQASLEVKAPRPLTVYILPHSHTDIGYTEIQTDIEQKQVQNLIDGLAAARRTADYPPGSRFVWNVEVAWAADLYLRRLGEAQRTEFMTAVKQGQVALEGMYLNELTGLCRPEELIRLFRCATRLAEQTGVPIESAMISDVPGYTWGTVAAMAQAGIKYFSVAPNYFDRIGDILVQWENKPFYWVGPDGQSRVLVWIPFWGYAMSHRYHQMSPQLVQDFCAGLEQRGYPYEVAYVRWSGEGDNAVPDPAICDFVRDWNRTNLWPQFVIGSTRDAFRALEARHGGQLPRVSGDWTPYWEDGAGSSALETALNRASSDRVAQAETLWALLQPAAYPAGAFDEAWRHVLLYSEHTWGAWCSVSDPARRETLEQWAVKQSYAQSADAQSRDLLNRALELSSGAPEAGAVDLFNTASWARSELVTVPKFLCEGSDRVADDGGAPVASQRLANGELVMLARDMPPLAARRYTLGAGKPHAAGQVPAVAQAVAQGATLDNGLVKLRADDVTGAIVELRLAGLDANLADTRDGQALNDFLYFNRDQAAQARRNGPVRIRVKEHGPLVASLLIESEAPGCHWLARELRVVAGLDYVEILNVVDKDRLLASSYHAPEGKESLNFAFPFAVPDGQVRVDVPFGSVRPDLDQMPSACKNWFTVGRWADVANAEYGVTWVTLDAPLVQVGGLTANLLNSQTDPAVWRKQVGPTQKLYAWAMNNHWGTNYRAYQEGPHLFRFILRPHRRSSPAEAARLATGFSQPLLPFKARGAKPPGTPRLRITSPDVVVTGLKPSDDGQALIVRLWAATDHTTRTELVWGDPQPRGLWASDTSEKPLRPLEGALTLQPWGVVTVRAELAR